MRGNYVSPSELLQAQRETGKSYWDLIGQPLTPAVGYNINNPYSESEKSYKQWYNTDAKQTTQQDTKASNDQVLNELIQKYNNLQASMNKPKEQKEYEYDDLPSFKKGKDKFTSFAQQLGPKIYKEMNKRGVYSDAAYDNVMRQLAMESSYGQSDVALKNHNYGGVGFNGKTYFKYKNDDAFVKDYIRMMKSKYGAALKAKNTTQYAKALKAGGYYQDSLENYTNKLNAMSSMSAAAKRHRLLNPKMYEYQVLLSDMEEPAVSTRVEKPINKEPIVNTPIQTEAPLIPRPEYLESNSLIRKSFQQNMSNMLQGREFQFTLPGFKNGKNSKKPLSKVFIPKPTRATPTLKRKSWETDEEYKERISSYSKVDTAAIIAENQRIIEENKRKRQQYLQTEEGKRRQAQIQKEDTKLFKNINVPVQNTFSLDRGADMIQKSLQSEVNKAKSLGNEIKGGAELQQQERLDKLNDYKKGVEATATALELGLSGASLLGAYSNYMNWVNSANVAKKTLANLLQKAQLPMQVGGTMIDAYQTFDAMQNREPFETYYNASSMGLGAAGSVGASDVFLNSRFHNPKVDRVLDVFGILQNTGDFIKFGYDTLVGDKSGSARKGNGKK